MNVLLMIPPNKEPIRYPNHGLAYLTSYVRDFVDEVVGIRMYTLSFSETSNLVKLIKKIEKDIIIIVGGPSGYPEETLKQLPDLDFAVIGEGEIGFRKLLEFLKKGNSLKKYKEFSKIPGLVWRQNDKIICNEPIFIEKLKNLRNLSK